MLPRLHTDLAGPEAWFWCCGMGWEDEEQGTGAAPGVVSGRKELGPCWQGACCPVHAMVHRQLRVEGGRSFPV